MPRHMSLQVPLKATQIGSILSCSHLMAHELPQGTMTTQFTFGMPRWVIPLQIPVKAIQIAHQVCCSHFPVGKISSKCICLLQRPPLPCNGFVATGASCHGHQLGVF